MSFYLRLQSFYLRLQEAACSLQGQQSDPPLVHGEDGLDGLLERVVLHLEDVGRVRGALRLVRREDR